MTDTLAPVERTNWALSAWNPTLDRIDVPSACLYGQDHLWTTGHLVSSGANYAHFRRAGHICKYISILLLGLSLMCRHNLKNYG